MKKNTMIVLLAMAFTGTVQAQTLRCQIEKNAGVLMLFENKEFGQAFLKQSDGQFLPLEFTEEYKVEQTVFGPYLVTEKNFSYKKYGLEISLTGLHLIQDLQNPEIKKEFFGTYTVGQQIQSIMCSHQKEL
jgi:hypothetical protein